MDAFKSRSVCCDSEYPMASPGVFYAYTYQIQIPSIHPDTTNDVWNVVE